MKRKTMSIATTASPNVASVIMRQAGAHKAGAFLNGHKWDCKCPVCGIARTQRLLKVG